MGSAWNSRWDEARWVGDILAIAISVAVVGRLERTGGVPQVLVGRRALAMDSTRSGQDQFTIAQLGWTDPTDSSQG